MRIDRLDGVAFRILQVERVGKQDPLVSAIPIGLLDFGSFPNTPLLWSITIVK